MNDRLDKTQIRIVHQGSLDITEGPHTSLVYNGKLLARAQITLLNLPNVEFEVWAVDEYKNDPMVKSSLIFCIISFLQRQNQAAQIKNVTLKNSDFVADAALFFKFKKTNVGFSLDFASVYTPELRSAYQKVQKIVATSSPPYFVEDGLLTSSEAEAVQKEYAAVAWGYTHWARNVSVQSDELKFIQNKLKGGNNLEIGVGSGRLTEIILSHSTQLTGTDREKSIIDALALRLRQKNLFLKEDDFVHTQLKENSFDHVLFLENGLGAIASAQDRIRIFANAYRILKDDGRFLIAVRSFGAQSKNQLMPATQNNTLFGIYRTFSFDEIMRLTKNLFRIVDQVEGDPRPAGGRQLLFEMVKVH